jgi:SH3-like domain-containing protein
MWKKALKSALAVFMAVALTALGASAAEKKAEPLPRFVSLKADVVNLRTGPGDRYPVEWVYHRKGLPVEIIAQYDQWRRVRDWQGTEGWVHQRLVTGTRMVIVKGAQRVLHAEAEATSPPVAKLDPGVIAHLLECRGDWCRVETQDIKGWLARDEIWGVYPDEVVR